MFFSEINNVFDIAKNTGCSIFVLPDDKEVSIKNAFILMPKEKSVITIEQVRDIISKTNVKENKDIFIIIRPADLLGLDAANALLKSLEEPNEKIHYVLITNTPSKLLPTILSRASIYFLKQEFKVDDEIKANDDIKKYAKQLIVAKPNDLVGLVNEIAKKREGVRQFVLEIISTAIEMLYRSYLITQKSVFIKKLPKFLSAYESISRNGHIKLHLVADLC